MAIEHRNESREEVLNEKVSIIFTPCWESESSWEEVSIKYNDDEKKETVKVGSYSIYAVAGEREWIEYDSKHIIFFGGNRYQSTTYITRIYDIEKREFVPGTINKLNEYYKELSKPDEQCQKLTKAVLKPNE